MLNLFVLGKFGGLHLFWFTSVDIESFLQAEQIHAMTTLFTQNDEFFHPGNFLELFKVKTVGLLILSTTVFFSQLEINHLIQQTTKAD